MSKKPQLKNLPDLDPFEVFIEMHRQGKTQISYAKKFKRSQPAISYAFQGKSKTILNRIAKDLGMIQ